MRRLLTLTVLPFLALAACGPSATPTSTASPPSFDPLSPGIDQVEVVYLEGRMVRPGAGDPLWGDLAKDRAVIVELFESLDEATLTDIEDTGIPLNPITVVIIQYADGSIITVSPATQCTTKASDGVTAISCEQLPDHWHMHIAGREAVVESTATSTWWGRMAEYMPPVESLEVPQTARRGETFTVFGRGWPLGDTVKLTLELSDRQVLNLGEIRLDHGAFEWTGQLPSGVPEGQATVRMEIPGVVGFGKSLVIEAAS